MDKEKQKADVQKNEAQRLETREEKVAHRKAFTHAGLPLKVWLLRHEGIRF